MIRTLRATVDTKMQHQDKKVTDENGRRKRAILFPHRNSPMDYTDSFYPLQSKQLVMDEISAYAYIKALLCKSDMRRQIRSFLQLESEAPIFTLVLATKEKQLS